MHCSAYVKSGIDQVLGGNFDWFCLNFVPFPLVMTAMQFLSNSELTSIIDATLLVREEERLISLNEYFRTIY